MTSNNVYMLPCVYTLVQQDDSAKGNVIKGPGFEFEELSEEALAAMPELERSNYEKAKKAAELRAAEKFIVKLTGDYECSSCSYVFNASKVS
jgi:hypothetical protein